MDNEYKVSRIDIIGQNGNDGEHYEECTCTDLRLSVSNFRKTTLSDEYDPEEDVGEDDVITENPCIGCSGDECEHCIYEDK